MPAAYGVANVTRSWTRSALLPLLLPRCQGVPIQPARLLLEGFEVGRSILFDFHGLFEQAVAIRQLSQRGFV